MKDELDEKVGKVSAGYPSAAVELDSCPWDPKEANMSCYILKNSPKKAKPKL